ncbi:type I-E CRISPR-associated endoribonuclease Cas2e [Niveispirillum sp. BGYR6]|uniref:type I-E CRISPR-associated endoribonuclease Cas2e n=1 Tax=Niveispirillum sp. BGYR6 TaxID=2971249 RepID=UPI0022B972FB|nr:type I-E CRISPR-associated endoribonuclease Cas2e [Niveispirillum sp. BGYR6]MDG5497350.1 type I-E CRISPR-associated endoribonuclease Cas2e [Niveispirillum sp. BGYR6]
MPMTLLVTRDVPDRFRGFLASVMLELAPGLYVSPALTAGVRGRIWRVMAEWHGELGEGSIVLVWQDRSAPGGLGMEFLGTPARELVDYDGLYLARLRAGAAPDAVAGAPAMAGH